MDNINYDQTDFLQAPHHIVLCCPANLETNSAALRFIFREHNVDAMFSLRPEAGNVLTLPATEINGISQTIHLLITRSTPRCPMTVDILLSILDYSKITLVKQDASEVHFSIIDPERPLQNLYDFYTCLMDFFCRYCAFRRASRSYVRFNRECYERS